MNICVVGTGYVGLVTGACLAELGMNVVCMDSDSQKIDLLKQGENPIYEPGLEDLTRKRKDGFASPQASKRGSPPASSSS
jgi:UDPglucose 6-dehydrogenase